MATGARGDGKRSLSRGEIYRQARIWHGYLSALAFFALIFFSATGLLLNHPEWLSSSPSSTAEQSFILSPDELAGVKAAEDPPAAVAALAANRLSLRGAYRSGDVAGADVFIRLDGVKGLTDLTANLETGKVSATVEAAPPLSVLNALHRAEHAGTTWRLIVDILAVLFLVTSLIGLVIFFSLRFRLAASLVLMGLSLAILAAVFVFAVP